ncbi:M23 family metallopeptidase [Curtobacterium sp. MCPF17_002]|uniref:murein hydrolase activator EnvC family protein n=1 Tax=Curtobacterium sp. MCPF17_002 TaxID=2175645 RepID=UPI0015E8B175|nr:M23 family metallopeptidase [Curtobacterium sp. MCPF17_002]WIB76214.1 M23 family metallopeptidase [Curtobacterium sp. MCPF17_002]
MRSGPPPRPGSAVAFPVARHRTAAPLVRLVLLVGSLLVGSLLAGSVLAGTAPVRADAAGAAGADAAGADASGADASGAEASGADAGSDETPVTGSDAAAPWVWPTGTRVVVRPWDAPADDYSAGHRGLDVPAALGTAAVAVDDGTVAFAGSVGGRQVVTVDHGDGLVSTLDSISPKVAAGDVVEQGDEVGAVAVGHCPAAVPCLHLGARIDGRYVNPTPYLPAAEWPVLLPESAWDG